MQTLQIKANFGYLGTLVGLCLAATVGCVAFILYYQTLQVLMALCGVVLLAGAAFLVWIMRFYVTLGEEEIFVSAFSKTRLPVAELDYMEFSFFEDKNGVGYIYLKNGDSAVLPKRLFAKALKPALQAYAQEKGIEFRQSARKTA